jgi:Skp family chaperone for outer membrane proteins
MYQNNVSRFGWIVVLLALGALWLRVEHVPLMSHAAAAPKGAEDKTAAPKPAIVGVLNVDRIWDNYKKYLDEVASVQRQVAELDEEIKRESKALVEISEQFKLQPNGSEAQLQLQLKYNQQSLALNTRVNLKRQEFSRRMAELWHDHYQEIERVAEQVAKQRKFDLILKMNAADMKRDDQQSVLTVVNRIVVYRRDELDITDDVLARLNNK